MALNSVPVSVLIPCYNSADVIGDCLESVFWADEIFVCDSFSTDATPPRNGWTMGFEVLGKPMAPGAGRFLIRVGLRSDRST